MSQTKLFVVLLLVTAALLASATIIANAPNWPVAIAALIAAIGLLSTLIWLIARN